MTNCLIYNSKSGSYNQRLVNVVKKKFELLNPDVKIIDACNNINLDGDFELICVAGGDGTINNTINQIYKNNLQEKVKLIIVPLGSANLLGHVLGVSKYIIFKNWQNLKPTIIEIGKINEQLFLTAGSLGNISLIINQTKKPLKKFFGFGAYVFNLLKNWSIKPLLFTLIIDGHKKEIKANSLVFSVGLNIIGFQPRFKKPDGLIDVYLLNNKTPFGYLTILTSFIFNKSNKTLIKFSGKEISCQTATLASFQVDGEKKDDVQFADSKITGKISVLI